MSSLEDPLEEYTGLSLFSRTLSSLPKFPHPCNTDDPLLLHDFLKSLPVKNSDKLVTVAKKILDKSKSEVSNPEIMPRDEMVPHQKEIAVEKDMESPRRKRSRFSLLTNSSQPSQDLYSTLDIDKLKDPAEFFKACERHQMEKKEIDKRSGCVSEEEHQSWVPRPRRPGIPGRKRPQFKLLPNSSQPSQDLYPTLDIDKLKDPAEFFKACERHRMANKEVDRLLGRVSEEEHQSWAPRPRRPGIPGRKRPRFKLLPISSQPSQDLYPTLDIDKRKDPAEFCKAFEWHRMSSEEAILDEGSQQETACGDIASQKSEMENFVPPQGEHGNLELEKPAVNDPVLKAETRYDKLIDELLALDREELYGDGGLNLIKEHLQIKSFDIKELNFPEMPNPHLKASGGIMQNRKQKTANNSIHTLGSPTPPKNPFAYLHSLKKRILHSNPRSDPFSAVGIDQLPAQLASFRESRSLSSNLVNADKDLSSSRNFKTQQIEEDDDTNGNTSFPEIATGSVAHPYDKSVNDDLTAPGSHVDDAFDDLRVVLEGNSIDMDNNILDGNVNRSDADVDVPIYKANEVENAVEDEMRQEAVVSVQPGANIVGFSAITSCNIQNQFEKSSPLPDCTMDGCNETQDFDSGECQDAASEFPNENINGPASLSMTKRIKGQSHQCYQRERRAISRRQSLAAASGTSWENGVRRSSRMRSRPLEYWKGERFLYGRIHESLATVIGIKYESPGGAAGKPTLKVKSFVSEEYKDLVELAALH